MSDTTLADRLVVRIVADVADLIAGYEKAAKETDTLGAKFSKVGQTMTSVGQDLTLKVTAPLTLMGGAALMTAANFDDSMRQVRAVTGATGAEFDKLREQAIQLGADTAWSAGESADAMKYLGMAGLSTNEILEATPQMLSLASAGALELGEAADIATNVLSGFNLQVSDLAHVSDVIAQAAASANTSVAQLGTAMSYVGPVASAAGMSIEETTAAIQVLSNSGIQGTRAGTSLRTSLANLLAPTSAAEAILAKYGVTLQDVNPEVHSFAEILDTLNAAGMSTGETMELFGSQAGPAMISLLRTGGDGIREYTAALENCDGAAQQMAETMEGGVGGQLRELEGAIETLAIRFGDLIAEALMPMIAAIRSIANWLSSLDKGTQTLIVTVGMFAAAVGPAVWVLGSMATATGSLINLYRVYQASTVAATVATRGFSAALMSTPAGLVLTGVTLLAGVLLTLSLNTDRAADATNRYTDALSRTSDELRKMADETRNAEHAAVQFFDKISAGGPEAESIMERLARSWWAQSQEIRDAEADTYEYLATLKDVATVAETELQRADKAFRDHQTTVQSLQTEYSKLELEYRQMCDAMEEARNRALGIDKDIESAARDEERADIQKIRAEQRLKEIEDAIKEAEREHYSKEYQTRSDWQAAEDALNDLRLREREARLNLADAIARYDEAVQKSADLKQEKTDLEIQLNDESIASAKTRLEELAKQIDEETEKMNTAQIEREEAERVHQIAMSALEQAGTEKRMMDWATAKKWIEENPIIAKIYTVSYDETGTASYTPPTPVVNITPPTLEALDLANVGRSGSGSGAVTQEATTTTTTGSGDVVIQELNVYSPKADATTMMQETRSTLRDAGSRVVV